MPSRTMQEIALDIRRNWPKPYFGAVPYIIAMGYMESMEKGYGLDTGESIVLYFLSNATGWRGPEARRIKTELKGLIK